MSWTDERIEKLTKMWEGGATASQIAEELGGVSRNAVIGSDDVERDLNEVSIPRLQRLGELVDEVVQR